MRPHTIVLHDTLTQHWLRFTSPDIVLRAKSISDIPEILDDLERLTQKEGKYAAGFISYEASPAFDQALVTKEPDTTPLMWFGVYDSPEKIPSPARDASGGPLEIAAWQSTMTQGEYHRAIDAIRSHIREGDTYQVNYTARLTNTWEPDLSWQWFCRLIRAQQCRYGAMVNTGDFHVISASPELFFTLDGESLVSLPMKGTAGRLLNADSDRHAAEKLGACAKNQAENVMIVDMIRNDMGRVARAGSVYVPQLFTVEAYPTVWQMISEVRCRTPEPVGNILRALFPCASITGAPKARTMEIIAALETTPRGVYTGSIGYLGPGRQAQFNVAIRTIVVDVNARQALYGTGGGVVWDSTAEGEYAESLLKAQVLTAAAADAGSAPTPSHLYSGEG